MVNSEYSVDSAFAVIPPGAEHVTRDELLGHSPPLRRTLDLVHEAARGRSNALIVCERGLGAVAVAREIHEKSRWVTGHFVCVECAAAEPSTVERELFGDRTERKHWRSTDLEPVAQNSRIADAHGGTLFLANVDELPAWVQSRLARLVRDGEMRVEATGPRPFDARIVASSLPGIDAEIDQGRFRADLFRRLAVVRIEVPPLRQRADDIPLLAEHFLGDLCATRGIPPKTFTREALMVLAALPWRGNVVELCQVLDHLAVDVPARVIQLEDVLPHVRVDSRMLSTAPNWTLREARARFEREYVAAVLRHHQWRISDAARALGIQRANLYRKTRQLGIARTKDNPEP